MKRERHLLLSGIDPRVLAALKQTQAFIAGGAIASIFSGSTINDYDIYFRGENLRQSFQTIMRNEGFEQTMSTDCADSYKVGMQIYQVIKVYYGEPRSIVDKFDFTICQGAYDFAVDDFYLPHPFLVHLAQKRLVYTGTSEYPVASMYRLKKYVARGFEVSGLEIVKIALQIATLNLRDYKDLRKQLMGIDTLFMKELTDNVDLTRKYDFGEFMVMMEQHLEKSWERG